MKKELFELLAYLDSQKETAQLIIITNGSLVDRQIITKLRRVKRLNQIKISLDGSDASSNDAIRGRGSFDKATKAIRLLKKESELSIIIMFTVMRSNLKQVIDLFHLCQRLKLDGLIIERFFPMGRGSKIKHQVLQRSDWFSLVQDLLSFIGEPYTEEVIAPYRAFWLRPLNKKTEFLGASCNIGRDSFCIMPDASVLPCRRFNVRIGNLLEDSLDKLTDSAILTDIVNGKPKGRCADCDILDCRGCAALSYLIKGDYLSGDLQCWYGIETLNQVKR